MIMQRAKKEDVYDIKKLLSETWVNTYGGIYSKDTIQNITSQWHKPELLVLQIQDPVVYFGIAKEQNQIVGLITLRRVDKNILIMNRLYVHSHFQRKGIGTKLMEEALKMFQGYQELRIEVEEQNIKGISFYKKQGFKEIRRKIEKVGKDEILTIEMVKIF